MEDTVMDLVNMTLIVHMIIVAALMDGVEKVELLYFRTILLY